MAKSKKTVRPSRKSVKKRPVPSLWSKQRRTLHRAIRANGPLHRRVVLHPTTLFGLLLVGVLLAGLTYRSSALQYVVSAVVHAPMLTTGATISSPSSEQKFTSRPITVSGICPDDSYVKLFRNGMFSGSAVCVNNVFQIQSDLFEGLNDLQVQAYNVTDDAGPQTPVVQVTYTPPAASEPVLPPTHPVKLYTPPASPAEVPPVGTPLLLWSDYHFSVFSTTQQFKWTLSFSSGTPPYAAVINWGDGQQDNLTVKDKAKFTISHSYARPGYYPVIITGRDAAGRQVGLQLVALIKNPGADGTIGSIVGNSSGGVTAENSGYGSWLWLAWPTYVVVSLMAASFWLGERREIMSLLERGKVVRTRKPRPHHR